MTDTLLKHVRVWVTDVWDNLRVPVTPGTTVADLKVAGLERAMLGGAALREYSVKYRGGLVLDETRTLEQLGVPDDAPFIILPTRRRPVS
jgi:hypothetical protein